MSDRAEKPRKSAIELAMERVARDGVPAPTPEVCNRADEIGGRRDYDRALALRHQQISAALGEADCVVELPLSDATAPAPAGSGFSLRTLMLTAALSALGGAGAALLLVRDTAIVPPRDSASAVQLPSGTELAETGAASERPIRERIEEWRQAWARRDVDAYLALYSSDFVPAEGKSRMEWVASRRKAISSRPEILVRVNKLRIEQSGSDQAKAHFLQDYVSGSFRALAQPKTLLLKRQDGQWRIAGEIVGRGAALLKEK